MVEEATGVEHGTGSGTLCLDFANTVDWHSSSKPKDTLGGYAGLLEWSRLQGLVSPAEAASLVDKSSERAKERDATMADAVTLREAIYRLFSAGAHGKAPAEGDLDVLNDHLARGLSRARVRSHSGGYRWGWDSGDRPLGMMLWPIARSAAELLTSENYQRVKECANEEEGCGWLFLDTSRSQNRVWCSMKGCGNRAKFRRYYRTHSAERERRAKD